MFLAIGFLGLAFMAVSKCHWAGPSAAWSVLAAPARAV
jgi:hypothetical protein